MSNYIIWSTEDICLSKHHIEEILEREISDELFEKYLDDFSETLDNHFYIDECVKDVLREHCEVLTDLESELN